MPTNAWINQERSSCLHHLIQESNRVGPAIRSDVALGIWVWIIGFSVAALVATYVMFVEPPPPRTIVIASGSPNGAYYRYAQQYAHELQKEHFTVEVRETAGSVENLQLLGQQGSGVTVAIVQSGVASARRSGTLPRPGEPLS